MSYILFFEWTHYFENLQNYSSNPPPPMDANWKTIPTHPGNLGPWATTDTKCFSSTVPGIGSYTVSKPLPRKSLLTAYHTHWKSVNWRPPPLKHFSRLNHPPRKQHRLSSMGVGGGIFAGTALSSYHSWFSIQALFYMVFLSIILPQSKQRRERMHSFSL